jgi:ABC-type multidrug transport system ATPase subunit
VIGPNGIGKSTLLKIATGRLQADHGSVEWGYATHTAYFAQDHRELLAERSATVEGWLGEACPGRDIGWVRGQLGKVLFSGDDVTKSVDQLSGGEAARLIFARIAVEQPNVMVLDEPTNHLDLEAIEALVDALGEYDGTLVFVSHDRWFVSRLATRILELGSTGVTDYRGSYADYVATCGDDHLDVDVAATRARRERRRGSEGDDGRRRHDPDQRQRQRRLRDLELRREVVTTSLEAAESRAAEITETFADPGFYQRSSDRRVRALETEHQRLREQIDDLMAEWERLEREIEFLQQADAKA